MPNRLAASTSPYLLQHAENPVNWHEWDAEAFALARRENKPIFLSIGYSTCHWCHVMAHESFENSGIAAVLNEYYVSIKVDREERPDIDRLYMAFVQATTGSGGWPMSVWLTPKAEPFFGGTYFPPSDQSGRPGFVTVLERIAELWAGEPDRILAQGADVLASLRETSAAPESESELDAAPLRAGFDAFAASYDSARGGFGGGPKFPRPSVFNFLLRRPEPEALEMTLHTLRCMAAGGLRDHLAGGFHRYSVDGAWHVPHFEKMLYDQAQLVGAYLDAWQITGDARFAVIVRETLDYVTRDLTHARGGFFSAEDADSLFKHGQPAHGEGVFYVWSAAEIAEHLDPETTALFVRHFGVEPGGNVDPAADPHHEFTGRNILFERAAAAPGDEAILRRAREILTSVRAKRPRPHLDDKVLTAWNGLMISACARAGAAMDAPEFLAIARRAAGFLRDELFDASTGELRRTWREGRAAIRAFAEDYAFLIQGLLDLYEADFDPSWLQWAIQLQSKQDALFFDEASSSYLGSAEGDPFMPLRLRDDYDGAEPSANSVAARNLLRLGWMLHADAFIARAHRVIHSFETILRRMPSAVPQMLCALDMLRTPPRQWVIAGPRDRADTKALSRAAQRAFDPNRVLLLADGGDGSAFLSQHSTALGEMKMVDGKAALYRCENFTCRTPVTAFPDNPARP